MSLLLSMAAMNSLFMIFADHRPESRRAPSRFERGRPGHALRCLLAGCAGAVDRIDDRAQRVSAQGPGTNRAGRGRRRVGPARAEEHP